MSELELDRTHVLKRVTTPAQTPSVSMLNVECDDVIVNVSLYSMFSLYSFWKTADLRQVARLHGIHLVARDNKVSLKEKLLSHACVDSCPLMLLTFTTLRVPRSQMVLDRAAEAREDEAEATQVSMPFLREVDRTLRDGIIAEWQDCMSTANVRQVVCAVCARYTKESGSRVVELSEIDLGLLRNDALHPRTRPSTYRFDLYDRALLCPQGMSSREERGAIRVCDECHRDLVEKKRMPKFSLANWLYYGQEALPSEVKAALDRSTQFDRLLVARARGSRISYRFTELKTKRAELDDEDVAAYDRAAAQRFVKGNVIVMPQNSTHLNSVLPPSPSVIRDTVCAVFVGSCRPTKETIRKLSPVLARKSTVKTIIDFLVRENPHYARDTEFHGFSQRNLDLLFDSETGADDEGLPCAMSVGFLPDSEALQGISAGYTARNDEVDEPPPGADILMENVGYTCGDNTPVAYQDMKMRAVDH